MPTSIEISVNVNGIKTGPKCFFGKTPYPAELEALDPSCSSTRNFAAITSASAEGGVDDLDVALENPQYKYTYRFRNETDHKHPLELPKEGPYVVQIRALSEAKAHCNEYLTKMLEDEKKTASKISSTKRLLPKSTAETKKKPRK